MPQTCIGHSLSFALAFLFGAFAHAQGGWTAITDASNPINTINSPGNYKGAAWVDFDNDGDIDLFAAPKFLFRNEDGGVFTQVTTVIGATSQQIPSGTSWADLDNDGDIDCIQGQWPSAIYLNNGDGTFSNESSQVDSLDNYAAWGCAIGDLDEDPFLDLLYVQAAGFMGTAPLHPCRLLKRSTAAVTSTTLANYAFTDSLRPYTVPYWSDFDLDGDMDLFIASGPAGTPARDYCYLNLKADQGLDTLVRMTTQQFAVDLQDGQCYNFIDYDNDGDLDLCLTNYHGAPTRLYNNNGGSYNTVTAPFTIAVDNLGNNWGDFDNDGDLDVIVTRDGLGTRYFTNAGNGSFTLVASGLSTGVDACGVSNGDYDNDGDLDVFVHGSNAARKLFRNDAVAQGNHWVNIRLEGVQSNRSAIGAIVRLTATINGVEVTQLREVNAQNGFQSQNDLRVHFGLGDAVVISEVEVIWSSGIEQLFGPADADQFYTLLEGGALTTSIADRTTATPLVALFPNPTNNALNVSVKSNTMRIDWRLIATDGKEVRTGSSNGGPFTIDVSGVNTGRYLLRCQTGSSAIALPFIKQ